MTQRKRRVTKKVKSKAQPKKETKQNVEIIAEKKSQSVKVMPPPNGYGDALSEERQTRYAQVAQYERDLLSGYEELALLKTLLFELVEKLETHEAGIWWQKANEAYTNFNRAMKLGSYDPKRSAAEMEIALSELESALTGGSNYYATLDEIQSVAQKLSTLRDRELKRVTAQDNALTRATAHMWLLAIAQIIREEVRDDTTKQAIAKRMKQVTDEMFPTNRVTVAR